jgi:3-(3-hydroxy-phenyl)propionate hydroxylase
LSMPATLHTSPLNTPDRDAFAGAMVPGAPSTDAPLLRADGSASWLLRELGTGSFTALVFDGEGAASAVHALQAAADAGAAVQVLHILPAVGGTAAPGTRALRDAQGLLAQRFDAEPGTAYLLRPDQHVCARWRAVSAADARAALRRALALS